ncbi:unnamed protein product [Prorocentrum cordatum]|uniref:Uncharacterized protein n=1 Tax=Prorocentrum cordatum TaxID=2364126 RepID=A0ABN9WFT6_9DINO|nr:unnamed protein product [Polarella glacialis]
MSSFPGDWFRSTSGQRAPQGIWCREVPSSTCPGPVFSARTSSGCLWESAENALSEEVAAAQSETMGFMRIPSQSPWAAPSEIQGMMESQSRFFTATGAATKDNAMILKGLASLVRQRS